MLDYMNIFACSILQPRHQKIFRIAYRRFPKKIKNKLRRKHVMVCDYFLKVKNPDKRIPGTPIGLYNVGINLIDIIPEESKYLSDLGLLGLIAHETAHAIIDNTFCFFSKIFFKIKFNSLPDHLKKFYREPEELHADWLAKSWGFENEIETLYEERQIKIIS